MPTSASGLFPLVLKCGYPTSSNFPLHMTGEAPGSGIRYGVIPLTVANSGLVTNNSIPLFVNQTTPPTGVMPFFVRGSYGDKANSHIPLFLQQDFPGGSFDLFIEGQKSTTHVQSGLTSSDGFFPASGSMTLMIERDTESTSASTRLFITGATSSERPDTANIPLFVMVASGAPSSSINLYLHGQRPSGIMTLYTRGY